MKAGKDVDAVLLFPDNSVVYWYGESNCQEGEFVNFIDKQNIEKSYRIVEIVHRLRQEGNTQLANHVETILVLEEVK